MAQEMSVRCCIAGGGPAGMMLGLLLARAGVDVLVLEKHGDFLRDFRGDTIHPSTLEVMHELGLLAEFLERPHTETRVLGGQIGRDFVQVADFGHLPTRCKFIALVPQWDFLDFLAGHARRCPGFKLLMRAEVKDLIRDGAGRVVGVRAGRPEGELRVRADLVVGADGRHSTVRERAGLRVTELGAPIDVLWMRLSKRPGDLAQSLGRVDAGQVLVTIDRGDYWQCAYVIPKGGFEALRRGPVEAFRGRIAELAPDLLDRVGELRSWDDVRLLTVAVNRLRRWHCPGLLCIGDAAHAMSPIGGVGINLAVQDAVAAANVLAQALRDGRDTAPLLDAVQRRRAVPTRATQRLQVLLQARVLRPVLGSERRITRLPRVFRLLRRYPALRRIPGRVIGMGFRPEHVRSPAAGSA
jgi:2-polyprenyl-6-methoxyphenol hydroxylase-like FAD-dependent oxidoreductase